MLKMSSRKSSNYLRFLSALLVIAILLAMCIIPVQAAPNRKPGAATLRVDAANNTGNYTVTVSVAARNTATSMKLYEGANVVLSNPVTPGSSKAQIFTYTVTNKAVGTYVYRADLTNAVGTTPSANLTVTVSLPPAPAYMFDDFNYTSSTDSVLGTHGWTVRNEAGGPGPYGCTFSRNNITFLTDPLDSTNKLMRLTASTNGTATGTSQAEIRTTLRKYNRGTYAARVRFTDTPTSGTDGAAVVETFFTISPLEGYRDPTYSELDFEYLPNGGWGGGQGLYTTSWHTYTEDPWYKDGSSKFSGRSYEGWHTLVITVATDGTTTYYIDGSQYTQDTPYYGPRKDMTINFNLWFIAENLTSGTYVEDVDWVYHASDVVLTPSQVNTNVQNYRTQGIAFTDTVN